MHIVDNINKYDAIFLRFDDFRKQVKVELVYITIFFFKKINFLKANYNYKHCRLLLKTSWFDRCVICSCCL